MYTRRKKREKTPPSPKIFGIDFNRLSLLYSPLIFPPIIKNVSLGVVISSMNYSCNYHRVCMQPINPKAIN